MKQRSLILTLLTCFLIVACTPLTATPTPTNEPESISTPLPTSTIIPTQTPVKIADMAKRLTELGGQPCTGKTGFTCVTLQVPLDHFDPANLETIDVVFAVAPAKGERKGMYIQALGGPGGKG